MISGDITKNLFTLHQVQRTKLQQRRDKVVKGHKKTYFLDDLHIETEDDDGPANFFPRMKF